MIKLRSYIFSFSFFFKREMLVTIIAFLLVILFAESTARFFKASGVINEDPRLQSTLEKYIKTIISERPDVWFVGNSTLDYSLDELQWSKRTGVSSIKMPLGGSTVRATVSMLEYYAKASFQLPKILVVFATKDDLNINGSRAKNSLTYLNRSWATPWYDTAVALRLCQKSIRNLIGRQVNNFARKIRSRPAKSDPIPMFDGAAPDPNDKHLSGLAANYQIDSEAVNLLFQFANQHKLQKVLVVLPPVTMQYEVWHDTKHSNIPVKNIYNEFIEGLKKKNIPVLGFRNNFNDHSFFRDSYHLNDLGKQRFTESLDIGF